MGKKVTNLKRAANLMVRYMNKGAIYTNQQRDILLSCMLAVMIIVAPLATIYEHRVRSMEREELAKFKMEIQETLDDLTVVNDSVQ